jgi:hypothetical protein
LHLQKWGLRQYLETAIFIQGQYLEGMHTEMVNIAGVLDEGMNDDGGRKEGRKRMDLLFVPFK